MDFLDASVFITRLSTIRLYFYDSLLFDRFDNRCVRDFYGVFYYKAVLKASKNVWMLSGLVE